MKRFFKVLLWIVIIGVVIYIGKKIIYDEPGGSTGNGGGGGWPVVISTPKPTAEPFGLTTPAPAPTAVPSTKAPVITAAPVTPAPAETGAPEPWEPGSNPPDVPQGMSGMFYYQLDGLERSIYDSCREAANSGRFECSIPDIGNDQYPYVVRRAYYAFEQDHPEFVWLTNGFTIYYENNMVNGMMRDCTL